MDYQTYQNEVKQEGYQFIPLGMRQDNPLYTIGEIEDAKKEIAKLFSEFVNSTVNQTEASVKQLNQYDEYQSDMTLISGDRLNQILEKWKENKNNQRPVVAVFVTDTSASMAGEPLEQLQKAFTHVSQLIDENHAIGMLSYNSDVYMNLPIQKFEETQRKRFVLAVNQLEGKRGTATFNAMTVAYHMLVEAQESFPEAKLMMFLLSDGETNTGYSLGELESVIKKLEIPVYTIGYNANISALKSISEMSNAASINADSQDVIYQMKKLLQSCM